VQRDHNGAVDSPETERLLVATRSLLSDRAVQFGLIVAVALLATYEAALPHSPSDATGSTAFVLNVLAIGPLIIARRWPALAAAASTMVTVVVLRTYQAPLAVASFCVSVFLLAHLVTRRGLLFAVPLLLPFVVLALTRLGEGHSPLGSTAPLLFLLAALVVGESIRRRRVAVAALDATKDEMAESVRAQTAMEERARIARELHDIVAHHLSVIAVESEATRLTSPGISADVGGRLESIAATAREALTETRRLLGVLREDTGRAADRAPQPGLGDLDDLIYRARATGTHIHLVRRGEIARLPRSIDLAAYRIVQEALTNARRHAPGADVDIEISYRPDALRLRVRDHGAALGAEPVAGHGLMGMRERATLAGGTFASARAEGGGFEIHVTLPTTETSS
jgi:signal transduction histidine kinase